ncbi:hypothetical protein DH2020_012939 [Rehmannia glutinosa]|uniref:Tf2-1-like SH3-like domain-containing protein n=1 Tax=Rehmannia glutinosa TaxID=99300 RepID=A0ABR0X4N6_REHGL
MRACTLDFQGSWDSHLPLAEFAYNNSYQATIGMAPYEALYGRKCRSPLHWEIDDQWTPKADLVQEAMEKVKLIKERIRTAQSRQKSYADKRRKDLEFEVGERIGKLAYRLELPAPYTGMHDVFHVLRLKKYQPDPEHIITRDTPPLMENLSYTERPIQIIDQELRQLRKREIPMVKVVWQNHDRDEDATWEIEEDMRNQYPELF